MSNGKTAAALLLGLVGLGIVAGVIYALYLIGAETLRIVVYVLAVPAGLAIILLAAAPVVRAWRTNVQPERQVHHYSKETRFVPVPDPRLTPPAPVMPQLPGQANAPLYPELLRAAFLMGQLQNRSLEAGAEQDCAAEEGAAANP